MTLHKLEGLVVFRSRFFLKEFDLFGSLKIHECQR